MITSREVSIQTTKKGLINITQNIKEALADLPNKDGLLNCFILHTSASLIIQENADPTAQSDLESFIDQLAPDDQSWHRHTAEGPDDSSSHMKAAVTNTSLTIPIRAGKICLGTWQGIFLWEHRAQPHNRRIILTVSQ